MRVEEKTKLAEYFSYGLRDERPYSLIYICAGRRRGVADATDRCLSVGLRGARRADGGRGAGLRNGSPPAPRHSTRRTVWLCPTGASVLEIERRSLDEHGRTVEGARMVMPGDRVEAVFHSTTRQRRTRGDVPEILMRSIGDCCMCGARDTDVILVNIFESGSGPGWSLYACRAPSSTRTVPSPPPGFGTTCELGLWPPDSNWPHLARHMTVPPTANAVRGAVMFGTLRFAERSV